MGPRLLCIGGEDHNLRIPFLLELQKKGFQITAAGSGEPSPFVKAGLTYHRINFERFINPISDIQSLNCLSRLIACVEPDVVQCFDTKLNVLVPLAARRFPHVGVVSTINGLGWLYSSRSPVALAIRPIYCALQRLAEVSVAVTVFQNSDDLDFFVRHRMVGSSEHLVIPGSGVDVARFEQAAASGPTHIQLRKELNLGDGPIVMTVTRVAKQKGIPTLLEAAAIVHKARPDVRFVIVGPHETKAALAVSPAEIARHEPYVQAIGPRSDVPALLGIADAFAFPTELMEGVPRVLLEAAIAGLPIVTTQMPGCTDVIRDGWSGFLVPPHAPGRLAERILTLLQDTHAGRAMGSRAAEFVRQEFNLDVTVDRYAAVYSKALDLAGKRLPFRTNGASGPLRSE